MASTNKEAVGVAQRIVALDAHYNSVRPTLTQQYKLLYVKRRNQLLQENARSQQDTTIRQTYLQLRSQLLAKRYGPIERKKTNKKSSANPSSSRQSDESLSWVGGDSPFFTTPTHSTPTYRSGVVPTSAARASRAMAGNNTLQEHYAFCGMHHIFDQHRDGVNVIKFAKDDKTQLACGSRDSTLSVFTLISEPPSLKCTLKGHEKAINDFDWSNGNDFIVSASSDGTYRLWDLTNGQCLRIIVDISGSHANCCIFHSQNGNFLITGNSKGQIKVYNMSTGKGIKGGSSKTAGSALSLTLEPSTGVVWAGDSKGSVFSFLMDPIIGKLQRLKRIVIGPGVPITSVSCRTWVSREARDPTLLLSCGDNTLRLYRIMSNGEVYLKRKMAVPHTTEPIKSVFCPLISFRQGACVVSGGEDGHVYMYDIDTGCQVNKLQGHSCPVLDVSWTYDEKLLSTCDTQGTIIVWKRCENETAT